MPSSYRFSTRLNFSAGVHRVFSKNCISPAQWVGAFFKRLAPQTSIFSPAKVACAAWQLLQRCVRSRGRLRLPAISCRSSGTDRQRVPAPQISGKTAVAAGIITRSSGREPCKPPFQPPPDCCVPFRSRSCRFHEIFRAGKDLIVIPVRDQTYRQSRRR